MAKSAKLESLILNAYSLSIQNKQANERYAVQRSDIASKISDEMRERDLQKYEFSVEKDDCKSFADRPQVLTCTRIEPTTITYDEQAMLKQLDKDVVDKLFQKEYCIDDIQGFIEMLKSHGVKPKEFKKFVRVNRTLDKNKLEQLYELGVLRLSDLKGCYSTKKLKGYWSIRSKAAKEESEQAEK